MHRTEGTNYTKDSLGRNSFTDGPPGTCVEAGWLNSVQEEIANVIEYAGLNLLTKATDTHTQLREAILQSAGSFEYIVGSQTSFNAMIERVAANQYKIKDDYSSVYIKFISGGYACYGGNSYLSGGDTWGYILTNNCKLMMFEGGAYLQFGDTPGYLNINTADCILNNPDVRGIGIAAAAISYSYYINNTGIKLLNPRTYNRKSNTNFTAFYSNVSTNENYICNPIVSTIDTNGGTLKAFYQCYLIDNPFITVFNNSSGITTIFDSCKRIVNFIIYNCLNTAESIYCFKDCYNVDSGEVNTVQHTGAVAGKNVYVFHTVIGIDDRNLYITSLSTNGAGGLVKIYHACTFRSRQIHQISKTADYTITAYDDFDELIANPNTVSQYGLLTITLLTGSQSNGQKQIIRHGDNQGLVKIVCQGGNKIRYKGTELDYVLLYGYGNYLEYHWNTTDLVYEVDKLVSIMKKNWDLRSAAANTHIGNGVTYDNGSGTSTKNSDWTGMVITEATSNFTAIVIADIPDVGGVWTAGKLYFYDLSSSFTFWTDNRKLTASNGHNIDVNEISGSSKNIDYNFYHGFAINLNLIKKDMPIVNTTASFNNCFIMNDGDNGGGAALGAVWQGSSDSNQLIFQTGGSYATYMDATGGIANLTSGDFYYYQQLDFSC